MQKEFDDQAARAERDENSWLTPHDLQGLEVDGALKDCAMPPPPAFTPPLAPSVLRGGGAGTAAGGAAAW